MLNEDTISSISTPLGRGAIGIVRLSGPLALPIAKKIFKSHKGGANSLTVSHRVYYGKIFDPATKKTIDEALVTLMKKPHSYTREDLVEISCHGGMTAVSKALDLTIKEGARLALPGEFTKRAFLNGRIDLTQAEAIIDLINAKTEKSLFNTVNQLGGSISREIDQFRSLLIDISSKLELAIDFSEEEIPPISLNKEKKTLMGLRQNLDTLIKTYNSGRLLRDGIKVVIAGHANAGKSSLFNTLLKKDRSIVTNHPGTTRDYIEEEIFIEGANYKIFDTAGLRLSDHDIESAGISRSYKLIEQADIIILMFDSSKDLAEEDTRIINAVKNQAGECLYLLNKIDLKQKVFPDQFAKKADIPQHKIHAISVMEKIGIEELKNRIKEWVIHSQEILDTEKTIINNLRHKSLLAQALESIDAAIKACQESKSEEFVAFDIRNALNALDEITGQTCAEDVLEKIFNEFCIGK